MPENLPAFHEFFRDYLLPVQLRHGARLIGRWQADDNRIVASWQYDDRPSLRTHRRRRPGGPGHTASLRGTRTPASAIHGEGRDIHVRNHLSHQQAAVNRWRCAFEGAPPYVDGGPGENLKRYLARDVTIVLGRQDSDRAALLLEINPAATAQGANRLERGRNYHAHARSHARAAGLAARHRLIQLTGVGHAARDVLAAPQTRNLVFG